MLLRNFNNHLPDYKCRHDFADGALPRGPQTSSAVVSCRSLVYLASPYQLHRLHSESREQEGF
jgi:hypothetical protein